MKESQEKDLYLGDVEGGKVFTAFPVQRGLTCLSQVGITSVNLVSISLFICFVNFTVLCLPKVPAG